MRQLPPEDYVALSRPLLEDPDAFLLVTGVARENCRLMTDRLGVGSG